MEIFRSRYESLMSKSWKISILPVPVASYNQNIFKRRFMRYVLPDLPYPYNALEPHMDEETVRFTHDMHHNGYERAEQCAGQTEKQGSSRLCLIKHSKGNWLLTGGIYAHTLYWESMSPMAADIRREAGQAD